MVRCHVQQRSEFVFRDLKTKQILFEELIYSVDCVFCDTMFLSSLVTVCFMTKICIDLFLELCDAEGIDAKMIMIKWEKSSTLEKALSQQFFVEV